MSVNAFTYEEVINRFQRPTAGNKTAVEFIKNRPQFIKRFERSRELNKDLTIDDFFSGYIGRLFWYLYIANQTAYSLNYEEPVNFFEEKDEIYNEEPIKNDKNIKLAIDLSNFRYNLYTGNGNYFCSDEWLDILEGLIDHLDAKEIRYTIHYTDDEQYAAGGKTHNDQIKYSVYRNEKIKPVPSPQMAQGGLIVGKYYKANDGSEYRFAGMNDASVGTFIDQEGKYVKKDIADFGTLKTERKKFGWFKDGGIVAIPDDISGLLKYAYPVAEQTAKQNGLILNEDYTVTDGGTKKMKPFFMTSKMDDKIGKIAINYFDETSDDSVGSISIDIETNTVQIDFPNMAVTAKDSFASGGNVKKYPVYWIQKYEGSKPPETVFETTDFDKEVIQKKFDEEAQKMAVGDVLEYGKEDAKRFYPDMLTVERTPKGLYRWTSNGNRKYDVKYQYADLGAIIGNPNNPEWQAGGDMFAAGGNVKVDDRTQKMLDSWMEEGRAFSQLNNDDTEFLNHVGLSYDSLGITSQTGNDIVYYNTDWYESDTDALKKRRKQNAAFGATLGTVEYPEWQAGGESFAGGGKTRSFSKGDEGMFEGAEVKIKNIDEFYYTVKDISETAKDNVEMKVKKSRFEESFAKFPSQEFAGGGEISDKFEVGTPVHFMEDDDEVSGEVVLRDGKKMVKLYRDRNYSGREERLSTPDWSKVKTFYEQFASGGKAGEKRYAVYLSTEITGDNFDSPNYETDDYDKAIAWAKKKSTESSPKKPKDFGDYSDYDYAADVFDRVEGRIVADFYQGENNYVDNPEKPADKKYYKRWKSMFNNGALKALFYSEKTGATDDLMKIVAANNPNADMKQVELFMSKEVDALTLRDEDEQMENDKWSLNNSYQQKKSITYTEVIAKIKTTGASFTTQKAIQEAVKLYYGKPVSGVEIKGVHYEKGGTVKKKRTTFADKVKAISSSLEGKKVPPKYVRKYGKKYSPAEAKEAAKKITGAMHKK